MTGLAPDPRGKEAAHLNTVAPLEPIAPKVRYYRYGGLAVKVLEWPKGPPEIRVCRPRTFEGHRATVPAAHGAFPRAAYSLCPLPKRYRRMIERLRRDEKFERLNVTMPAREQAPWEKHDLKAA